MAIQASLPRPNALIMCCRRIAVAPKAQQGNPGFQHPAVLGAMSFMTGEATFHNRGVIVSERANLVGMALLTKLVDRFLDEHFVFCIMRIVA